MPGINLRFEQDLHCPTCGIEMAVASAYSTLHAENGAVILFSDADPPSALVIVLECKNGHRVPPPPPPLCRIEWCFQTDINLPQGCTAIALGFGEPQSPPRVPALAKIFDFLSRGRYVGSVLLMLAFTVLPRGNGFFVARLVGFLAAVVLAALILLLPWESMRDEQIRRANPQ